MRQIGSSYFTITCEGSRTKTAVKKMSEQRKGGRNFDAGQPSSISARNPRRQAIWHCAQHFHEAAQGWHAGCTVTG